MTFTEVIAQRQVECGHPHKKHYKDTDEWYCPQCQLSWPWGHYPPRIAGPTARGKSYSTVALEAAAMAAVAEVIAEQAGIELSPAPRAQGGE